MTQGVFDNADKTRRAVVGGTKVLFYVRNKPKGGKPGLLRQVWRESYHTKADAVLAAEGWAAGGSPMLPGRRQ